MSHVRQIGALTGYRIESDDPTEYRETIGPLDIRTCRFIGLVTQSAIPSGRRAAFYGTWLAEQLAAHRQVEVWETIQTVYSWPEDRSLPYNKAFSIAVCGDEYTVIWPNQLDTLTLTLMTSTTTEAPAPAVTEATVPRDADSQTGPWSSLRTLDDWRKMLGISKRTLQRRLDDGTFRHQKGGKLWMIALADLPEDVKKKLDADDKSRHITPRANDTLRHIAPHRDK